jgi:hypothetical protein
MFFLEEHVRKQWRFEARDNIDVMVRACEIFTSIRLIKRPERAPAQAYSRRLDSRRLDRVEQRCEWWPWLRLVNISRSWALLFT